MIRATSRSARDRRGGSSDKRRNGAGSTADPPRRAGPARGADPGSIAHPALQKRSQRTQDRILDAASAILSDAGLGAATVPAIAERAGISVGAVYRRFPDKDAVLRAVVERFIARSARVNARALDPARWRGVPADVVARIFVVSVARTYRLRAGLIKALEALARSHPDPAFRKRIEEFNLDNIRRVTEILLERRDELDHPDPAAGVRFSSLAIAAMSRFLSLSDGEAAKLLDLSDERVEREMHRLFTRHLGIAEHPDGKRLAQEYGQRLRRDVVEEALAAGEISAEAARSALANLAMPTDDPGSSTAAKPRRAARKTSPSRSRTARRRPRA